MACTGVSCCSGVGARTVVLCCCCCFVCGRYSGLGVFAVRVNCASSLYAGGGGGGGRYICSAERRVALRRTAQRSAARTPVRPLYRRGQARRTQGRSEGDSKGLRTSAHETATAGASLPLELCDGDRRSCATEGSLPHVERITSVSYEFITVLGRISSYPPWIVRWSAGLRTITARAQSRAKTAGRVGTSQPSTPNSSP